METPPDSLYHPFLVGRLVYLRGLERQDISGRWFQWFNDPDVTQYMVSGAFPNSAESLTEFYETVVKNKDDLVLAIIERTTGLHIGNTGLHRIDWINRVAEFGIVVGEKAAWGKGYGTEATRLIVRHGFRRLNLHKISLGVHADHASAIHVYERVGFRQEALMREEIYRDGRYYDKVLMGLLHDEFFARDRE